MMDLAVFVRTFISLLAFAQLDTVSAAVVEYLASDNSSTAAWQFTEIYDYFYFDPRIYDILTGGCASVNVVGLGYGGVASINFTGSGVFLQTVSTTSGLPARVRIWQEGRVVSQLDGIRNDAGKPTCRSDLYSYTDLDPSQTSTLQVTATTEHQIGVPPYFMLQGIQVVGAPATVPSSQPYSQPSSSVPFSSQTRSTPEDDASPTSHQTPNGSTKVPLIAGAAVGGFVGALAVVLAGIALLLCRRRRARRQRSLGETAARLPVHAAYPAPDPAAASLIERSPSGKVTTMSAGLSSPWTGPASPDPTSTGRISLLSNGASTSAPLDPVGGSSLERARSVAPPAYGDVVRPLAMSAVSAEKLG